MNLQGTWAGARGLLERTRRIGWIDLLIGVALAGFLYGILQLAGQWTTVHQPVVEINIDSPWSLIRYTFFSLARGLMAYVLSLLFTFGYGYWAAKDPVAERVLVPLLDILQSIPVLGFLPGVVLALVALFPHNNVGLELAAVLMIFTGQAWNMTFSFYHSVKSVPNDQREVATTYRFNWWQRFKWVELPFSMMGLVWNSMMSMAGGWFFLTIIEAFTLEDQDFRLPGIGAYMAMAVKQGSVKAMLLAILAMTLMIVILDQLLWRPVVVWAEKFRVEEGGNQVSQSSWFLTWLRRSGVVATVGEWIQKRRDRVRSKPLKMVSHLEVEERSVSNWPSVISSALFILLLSGLGYFAWQLVGMLAQVTLGQWGELFGYSGLTLLRVLTALFVATLWAVPAGLFIGLSPRLANTMQPIVQVVASFPAPMLFLPVVVGLTYLHISLELGSIVLMLLGTQWYILFNVIAGSMAIPADLREAAHSYRINGWQRFWVLYFPAIFPYLLTGWVTAAGGAWNASIVAEYQTFDREMLQNWHLENALKDEPDVVTKEKEVIVRATGLGGFISSVASEKDKRYLLAASVLVMSVVVVAFNRTVWRYCYRLAETKFSLNK